MPITLHYDATQLCLYRNAKSKTKTCYSWVEGTINVVIYECKGTRRTHTHTPKMDVLFIFILFYIICWLYSKFRFHFNDISMRHDDSLFIVNFWNAWFITKVKHEWLTLNVTKRCSKLDQEVCELRQRSLINSSQLNTSYVSYFVNVKVNPVESKVIVKDFVIHKCRCCCC